MKLDRFPFHKLLIDTTFKEMEDILKTGTTEFTVKRLGTYTVSERPYKIDVPHTIIYRSTDNKYYYITRKETK